MRPVAPSPDPTKHGWHSKTLKSSYFVAWYRAYYLVWNTKRALYYWWFLAVLKYFQHRTTMNKLRWFIHHACFLTGATTFGTCLKWKWLGTGLLAWPAAHISCEHGTGYGVLTAGITGRTTVVLACELRFAILYSEVAFRLNTAFYAANAIAVIAKVGGKHRRAFSIQRGFVQASCK